MDETVHGGRCDTCLEDELGHCLGPVPIRQVAGQRSTIGFTDARAKRADPRGHHAGWVLEKLFLSVLIEERPDK